MNPNNFKMYRLDEVLESEVLPLVQNMDKNIAYFKNRYDLASLWNRLQVSPEPICVICPDDMVTIFPIIKDYLKTKNLWQE